MIRKTPKDSINGPTFPRPEESGVRQFQLQSHVAPRRQSGTGHYIMNGAIRGDVLV